MKLSKIIAIANQVYPDGMVQQAFDANADLGAEDEPVSVGDGLAEFIARELAGTYDPKASSLAQLQEAHRVMSRAHTELGDVATIFSDAISVLVFRRKR